MSITSVVAVADSIGIDTSGIQLAFAPGDPYPISGRLRLFIHGQPFPTSPPTRVLPSVTTMHLSYGRLGEGQSPPPIEPDEHWLRELSFSVFPIAGSWRLNGSQASVDVEVSARLRDNTPAGAGSAPDDPFVAFIDAQALCIWTSQTLTWWERVSNVVTRVLPRP